VTRLLLKGGRLLDPASGRDETADLYIADGHITDASPAADRTLDCSGLLVVPGLIDLHVHLREPPVADADTADLPETIATGAAAAVAGGFTTICAMPNTRPPLDGPEAIARYVERGRAVNLARVLPVGCLTRGREGREPADLEAMRAAGAALFSDDGSDVADPAVFEAALARAAVLGVPVSCHCEDATLAAGGVLNDSPMAMALGLPGLPPEAEEVAVQRACSTAARTGCHTHIAHVSTAGAVALIRRSKTRGIPVTAETTPHHLTLTDDALGSRDAVFKVNPPLRSGHDIDALIAGIRDGTIDCLATDHAPHTAAAKARGLAEAPSGMIGLETALPIYALALVERFKVGWPTIIRMLTAAPARVLGIPAGTLAVGAVADVTVIDPNAAWTIDPTRFASRARNCPFAGWQVRGRAALTLVGGKVVYEATPA